MLLRDMGDLTMAVFNLTQALKYKPNDCDALFQRAEIYETVSLIIIMIWCQKLSTDVFKVFIDQCNISSTLLNNFVVHRWIEVTVT